MPFRHSGPTTIRSFQFRENTYDVAIESLLRADSAPGKLQIQASPGYRLATPAEGRPQAQLSLDYTRQPEGTYLVRTTLRLMASGPMLVSGSVTLQEPTGHVHQLTIAIQAALLLSDATLTFNKPQLTDTNEVIAVLKITQQGTDTPVVVTTDDPDRFGLAASGQQRHFLPALTITPVRGQLYIYVRYMPHQAGKHQAWLVVQTPYASQRVALQGVAGKRVSGYRLPGWAAGWRAGGGWLGQPASRRMQRGGLLGILSLGGLVLASYVYRASFTAWLGRWPHPVAITTAQPGPALVVAEQYTAEALEQRFKNRLTRRVSIDSWLLGPPKALAEPAPPTRSPAIAPSAPARLANRREMARSYPPPIPGGRMARPSLSPAGESESDLEKELNRRAPRKDRVEWIQLAPVFRVKAVWGHHPRHRPRVYP